MEKYENPEGGQKCEMNGKKGFFDKMFDAAKDLGKMTTEGVSIAGKFVADQTKTAATTVWEKGKSIKVTQLPQSSCRTARKSAP